jgi:alpha-mannosidase
VIEDGAVRTVIESVFRYGDSFAIVHYKLPKQGAEVEIAVRVHWNEKSKFLKLSVPTVFEDAACRGQVAFGVQTFPTTGRELAAQKWVAVVSEKDAKAVTCINAGSYGSDCAEGELRLSLLRSPAYSAHPIGDRPLVRQDRYSPRIDQGERLFRFWVNAGARTKRLECVDREALVHNERPFALSFYPSGAGDAPKAGVLLSDDVIQLAAFKKAEESEDYILRLFEPTGIKRATTILAPHLGLERRIEMNPFEIKTLRLDPNSKTLKEVNLLEREP